jgi:YfiH family protein
MKVIEPDWPYSDRVRVFTTTRSGGVSQPPYESFNLGDHVGDEPAAVVENRRRVAVKTGGKALHWLDQVHGTRVVEASGAPGIPVQADGIWSCDRDIALAVLTADCLPVVLVDAEFESVGLAHGGWRGLAGGILAETAAALPGGAAIAWIGPGIGPASYEVGEDVLGVVRSLDVDPDRIIEPIGDSGKGMLDLFTLAILQLEALGLNEIYCERVDTFGSENLYSYRRDGVTGRMATVISRI